MPSAPRHLPKPDDNGYRLAYYAREHVDCVGCGAPAGTLCTEPRLDRRPLRRGADEQQGTCLVRRAQARAWALRLASAPPAYERCPALWAAFERVPKEAPHAGLIRHRRGWYLCWTDTLDEGLPVDIGLSDVAEAVDAGLLVPFADAYVAAARFWSTPWRE